MNSITLTGRIGSDIESREFESGAIIYKFRLAVRRWDRKKKEEIADWFFVQTFSKICPHLEKGMLVGVDGSMITNTYVNDKQEKVTRYIVEANTVEIYAKKKEKSENEAQEQEEEFSPDELIGEDEIPF